MPIKLSWLVKRAFALTLLICIGMELSESATKCVTVTLRMTSPLTLFEPVGIDVLLKNEGVDAITVDLGLQGKKAYHFRIFAPNGEEIDVPANIYMGSFAPIVLEPNDTFSQRLVLNQWYSFDSPGDYRILATLDLPIKHGKKNSPILLDSDISEYQVDSVTLNLTILPRNERMLRARCETLLRKLQAAYEFSERTPIAEELSYIQDPIAIPYLIKLIDEREEGAAIEGLMRIGTDEALEAMIAATRSEYNKAAAAMAKAYLRNKIGKIRNHDIQQKVLNAVE